MKDMIPVEDINIREGMTAGELMDALYKSGGFVAKHLAIAERILLKMFTGENTTFFSFPACINATGTRGVVKELVKRKLVDVIITTCGTLDHDIARSFKNYYHGSFLMDDVELHRRGVNRLGNVLVPNESYGEVMENFMMPILEELYKEKKEWGPRELIDEFGKRMDNEDSILYWAHRNNIPIYVPGITDGSFGAQLWSFREMHPDFRIDILKDEHELADIIFDAKKTGALMLGGGISKHHTIWWNQFRDGLDYAVYITTAVEWDGSLSGARVREAVSWGKVREDAKYITVEGDVTVLFPLLVASVVEKL
ncbi:MAG: deoxyhypusine synthase, partial [Euryarchaeota archaeon]|nr:deoxyhypusine synthase [Euryarchaeota archaeon]